MTGDPADLANLRDIVMPAAIPWWPLAPGIWILVAGLLATAIVASIRAFRQYQANAYRREAIRELDGLTDMTGIMPLLKRAAMVAYGRETVASLSGDAFLAFLDRTGGTSVFTAGPARLLPSLAYSKAAGPTSGDLDRAVADARRWLRKHRARDG